MTRAMHSAIGKHSAAACWRLEGTQAQLTADDLQGSIDVVHPNLGLNNLRVAGNAIAGWTLAVDIESPADPNGAKAWQPHEAYVRGNDLIVAYREPLGQPF